MVANYPHGGDILSSERFRFTLKVTRYMLLPPYKGSLFRGALGNVVHRAVCASHSPNCHERPVCRDCLYGAIFEPTPPPGFANAGRFDQAPRPFVLTPPLTPRQSFHPGDTLEFELVLIGAAIDALPYFVYAFTEVGRQGLGQERGTYNVMRVDVVRGDEILPIFDGTAQILRSYPPRSVPPADGPHKDVRSLSLTFVTPLRLKSKGELVTQPTFPLLFERLTQRISLLSAFYGANGGAPDFSDLTGKAGDISITDSDLFWYDWERYSGKQKRTMKLGGLRGTIRLEGELDPFLPWLKCGEAVHVGQNTTFGLGMYRCKEEDNNQGAIGGTS